MPKDGRRGIHLVHKDDTGLISGDQPSDAGTLNVMQGQRGVYNMPICF